MWNIASTLPDWLKYKTQSVTNVGEDVEVGEHLYTVGENVNECSHFGNIKTNKQQTKRP